MTVLATGIMKHVNKKNSSSGHGSSYVGSRYLGPAYYQNNREVSYHGNTLHPYSNLSVGRPVISSTAKARLLHPQYVGVWS